jgi:hypothetical protein
MSAVTMSGEASLPRPTDARGLAATQTQTSVDSFSKTETINAAKQPAAIIAQGLDRLTVADEKNAIDQDSGVAASRVSGGSPISLDTVKPASLDNPSMARLADQTQAQIASVAEIAILAQANQLPNDSLPFSTSA